MLRERKWLTAVVFVAIVGLGIGLFWLLGPGAPDAVYAQGSSYRLVEGWPQYPSDMDFEMGSGVAVDDDGVVYLFTRDVDEKAGKGGVGSISRFDRSGKFLGKWGPSDFITPHQIIIARDGFVWTVDRDGQQIRKFNPDGTEVLTVGTPRKWGHGPSDFNGPTALVVQPNGDFIVAGGYWNSRIQYFDKDGEFVQAVGTLGRGPGQFGNPHGMAQDSQGRLLVADLCGLAGHDDAVVPGQIAAERLTRIPNCSSRIQILDKDGNYLTEWTHVNTLGMTVVGDRVYVGDSSGSSGAGSTRSDIAILNAATGEEIGRIEEATVHAHQIAVDERNGDVYIASVYPEHGGGERGTAGPSYRRWTKEGQ